MFPILTNYKMLTPLCRTEPVLTRNISRSTGSPEGPEAALPRSPRSNFRRCVAKAAKTCKGGRGLSRARPFVYQGERRKAAPLSIPHFFAVIPRIAAFAVAQRGPTQSLNALLQSLAGPHGPHHPRWCSLQAAKRARTLHAVRPIWSARFG